MSVYGYDLISLPKSELRKPETVFSIARFWDLGGTSGYQLIDIVTDELIVHFGGTLRDWRKRELNLVALRPVELFGKKELATMKSLERFRGQETIEVYDLFGEDEGRTMNRLRVYARQAPKQSVSRALVPRFMFLEFAMRIRRGRLGSAVPLIC